MKYQFLPLTAVSEDCLGLTETTLSASHPRSHILENEAYCVPPIRISCQGRQGMKAQAQPWENKNRHQEQVLDPKIL